MTQSPVVWRHQTVARKPRLIGDNRWVLIPGYEGYELCELQQVADSRAVRFVYVTSEKFRTPQEAGAWITEHRRVAA